MIILVKINSPLALGLHQSPTSAKKNVTFRSINNILLESQLNYIHLDHATLLNQNWN